MGQYCNMSFLPPSVSRTKETSIPFQDKELMLCTYKVVLWSFFPHYGYATIQSDMKSRKYIGKIRTAFGEIDPQHLRFWPSIKSKCKKFLFINFSKAFDYMHRGKIEQMLLAYGILKETAVVTCCLVDMLLSNL